MQSESQTSNPPNKTKCKDENYIPCLVYLSINSNSAMMKFIEKAKKKIKDVLDEQNFN